MCAEEIIQLNAREVFSFSFKIPVTSSLTKMISPWTNSGQKPEPPDKAKALGLASAPCAGQRTWAPHCFTGQGMCQQCRRKRGDAHIESHTPHLQRLGAWSDGQTSKPHWHVELLYRSLQTMTMDTGIYIFMKWRPLSIYLKSVHSNSSSVCPNL